MWKKLTRKVFSCLVIAGDSIATYNARIGLNGSGPIVSRFVIQSQPRHNLFASHCSVEENAEADTVFDRLSAALGKVRQEWMSCISYQGKPLFHKSRQSVHVKQWVYLQRSIVCKTEECQGDWIEVAVDLEEMGLACGGVVIFLSS